MAFGQQSGPPASPRQIEDLRSLLHDAGYSDFREARHPLQLSQRQAGGRFTREEADALIARLREGGGVEQAPAVTVAQQRALRFIPAEQLAAELERRGWVVIAP